MKAIDIATRIAAVWWAAASSVIISHQATQTTGAMYTSRCTPYRRIRGIRVYFKGAARLPANGPQLVRAMRHVGLKHVSAGVLILSSLTTVHAEPSLKEAFADPRKPDIRLAINVSGLTLGWVNARLTEEGKPRLFCMPPGKAMTIDEYMGLMTDWIEKHDYIAGDGVHSFPRHLIDALAATYPC